VEKVKARNLPNQAGTVELACPRICVLQGLVANSYFHIVLSLKSFSWDQHVSQI
jgi:hypothetical protein